jgi:squalene synthase HpnD
MSQATQPDPQAANRARGSTFYLAMRILPREQREAMFEVYSFCSEVDDIADGEGSRDWRLARLAEWRKRIAAIYAGDGPHELEALARVVTRFGLRQEDFLAIIDGVEMDAAEDIRAPTLDQLDLYCDRVASAVGRLSVRIFGMTEDDGRELARHLGRALQLTNILRDVDEDGAIGRLYLPREALHQAGVRSFDPAAALADPGLGAACNYVAGLAREHFTRADAIIARCPRRQVRAPRIMADAYRQMLDAMVARGWAVPRERVRLGKAHLLRIALRYAFG